MLIGRTLASRIPLLVSMSMSSIAERAVDPIYPGTAVARMLASREQIQAIC